MQNGKWQLDLLYEAQFQPQYHMGMWLIQTMAPSSYTEDRGGDDLHTVLDVILLLN